VGNEHLLRSHAMDSPAATALAPNTSLAGATVVVTRPAQTAAAFKRGVVKLGAVVCGLPGMGLRAVADRAAANRDLRESRTVDIAIFISPSAVRYAFDLQSDLRFGRATRVFAIGAGTARALVRRGVLGVIHPPQQDSDGLLALPELARVSGLRVVVIGAPGGRDVLTKTLSRRGALLKSISVYQRSLPRLTRRHFAELDAAAAPLLTLLSSAEALDNLHKLLPAELFARLANGEGIVSSLRLAQAARSAGFVRIHIAASAGMDDMLAAAVNALAHHRL
jgi:uroporphyrinogen-III synthase